MESCEVIKIGSINSVLFRKEVYNKNISNNNVFDKEEEKSLHLLYLMDKALIKIFVYTIKNTTYLLNLVEFQILFCEYVIT